MLFGKPPSLQTLLKRLGKDDSQRKDTAKIHIQHKYSGDSILIHEYDSENKVAFGYNTQTKSYQMYSEDFLSQKNWIVNRHFKEMSMSKLDDLKQTRQAANNRDYGKDR